MKSSSPIDDENRFRGSLRHYHRAGGQVHRTWDEWVDGKSARPNRVGKWLKIVAIVLAFLVLGGVIIGLVIEFS